MNTWKKGDVLAMDGSDVYHGCHVFVAEYDPHTDKGGKVVYGARDASRLRLAASNDISRLMEIETRSLLRCTDELKRLIELRKRLGHGSGAGSNPAAAPHGVGETGTADRGPVDIEARGLTDDAAVYAFTVRQTEADLRAEIQRLKAEATLAETIARQREEFCAFTLRRAEKAEAEDREAAEAELRDRAERAEARIRADCDLPDPC